MLNGLDLFSGIGGITKALEEWVSPIAYCEIDRYSQGVLLSRMSEGELPVAPIWDNVETLKGDMLPIKPDIIYGGWPCTQISCAGNGKGLAGEHSKLFYEILRLAQEIRPPFIFLENVSALRTRGLREVGEELAGIGYDIRWDIVSSREAGADHLRKRMFLLAHLNSEGFCKETHAPQKEDLERIRKDFRRPEASPYIRGEWSNTPKICREADEVPHRMDRVKCLGGSVVPEQVKEAFKRLIGANNLIENDFTLFLKKRMLESWVK